MTPASWMTLAALLLAPAAGFWIGWRLGRAGPARHAPGHEWLAYAQGGVDADILAGSCPGGPEGMLPAAPDATGRTYLRASR